MLNNALSRVQSENPSIHHSAERADSIDVAATHRIPTRRRHRGGNRKKPHIIRMTLQSNSTSLASPRTKHQFQKVLTVEVRSLRDPRNLQLSVKCSQ